MDGRVVVESNLEENREQCEGVKGRRLTFVIGFFQFLNFIILPFNYNFKIKKKTNKNESNGLAGWHDPNPIDPRAYTGRAKRSSPIKPLFLRSNPFKFRVSPL